MRLAPFASDSLPNPVAGRATLDRILALNAARNPTGFALVGSDPSMPGSWAEVDRAVSSLADSFSFWGLERDTIVGVQLGSSPEAALTCLALWRAGLIPAMLPLAWRRSEIARAIVTTGAAAIIASTRRGGAPLAAIACELAGALETIRFVGSFGDAPPDGASPLDGILLAEPAGDELQEQMDDGADHVAVITFDAGGVPTPRTHDDLIAAGLGPLVAGRLTEQSALLSTLDLSGLAGLATGLAPWLTTGCAACFHQPSTTEAFAAAAQAAGATHVILPGRAAERLVADGALSTIEPLTAFEVWRAPDGPGAAKPLGLSSTTAVDVILFGELGLLAAARSAPARHVPLVLGPSGPDGLPPLVDLKLLADGRLFIRGPVCPQAAFGAANGAPSLIFEPDGYLDTGLVGVADRMSGHVVLGGHRRGVIQVGGVAVTRRESEAARRTAGIAGELTTHEDAIFGMRFALTATEDDQGRTPEEARAMLDAAGFGPALAPASVAMEPARRTA